ncbi:MAG: hypothetical protein M0Z54_03330 [Thermaerobacter sp.]|jgi:16S rRNA A1518/A1519 N6-dimethyltransferase RsmA/KsgA/DIM1 with predicted DNA glycosylase/AP lyase activity|nr:hypothetical protein [Thermaerobacter sp.]
MADTQRIMLDPSKFKIDEHGQVILTDPDLLQAIQQAQAAQSTQDETVAGIGVGVIVTSD